MSEIFGGGRILLLDGANGSLLQSFIEEKYSPLWSSSLLITDIEKVTALHREYIDAGADIITTNTFRTNPSVSGDSQFGYTTAQLTAKAVEAVRLAASGRKILIAGSNAPAEDCYSNRRTLSPRQLFENHSVHITALMDAGADFILNETFSHLDEIKLAASFCDTENIPYVISLFFTPEGKLLSGESLKDVVQILATTNIAAVSFNCVTPGAFGGAVQADILPRNWGMYLNCGGNDYHSGDICAAVTPDEYAAFCRKFVIYNPLFLGGCCGTGSAHIRSLRVLIDEQNYH